MKFSGIILLSIFIVCCNPPKKPSNIVAKGDLANITLKGNNTYQGELITVRDSILYMIFKKKITPINLRDIEKIEIPGYALDAGQRIGAALAPLAMEAFIFSVANDIGEKGWATAAGISMAVTIILYATTSSGIEFSDPILADEIKQIRLYCRYPQELNSKLWNEIITQYD